MLKEINFKVVSYCEIPEEIVNSSWLTDCSPNSYVEYTIRNSEEQDNELDEWIISKYPELKGTTFLIEIDY